MFEIADLIKDTIVMPIAFICGVKDYSDKEFRELCIEKFMEHESLDFLFDTLKATCAKYSKLKK